MLRFIRPHSGQVQVGEVVILFGIAVAAFIAMTTYVRRAYQGRIYDADTQMMVAAANILSRNIKVEYEPYYVQTGVLRSQQMSTVETRPLGVFTRDVDDRTRTISVSDQAAPYRSANWK